MENLIWIGLILLVVGFILVGVEMVLPGFGAPGISGIICLIAGIVLSSRSLEEGLLHTIIVVVILAVMMTVIMLILHKSRASSPMVLKDEMKKAPEYIGEEDLSYYLNKEGRAMTDLRPLGKGLFDGVELAVKSYDGKFIKHDAAIKIVSVKNHTLGVEEIK